MVGLDNFPDLEQGSAHGDAQGLGFVGAGHGATVVVGQHDDGFSVQFRTENAFAGSVEVVAVG